MLKSTKIQMLLVLVTGASIGYAAASGKYNPFQKADAAPPNKSDLPSRIHDTQAEDTSACCPNGARKGQLFAMADPKVKAAVARAEGNGKKPNIVFIMGDDVGWFNIGAYHRGIMSGKTPNLDKLASQGMLFTDYYAEASCTAGRANFITGEPRSDRPEPT